MATMIANRSRPRVERIPRDLRGQVENLLQENYAYMDSPTFRHKYVEDELFGQNSQPQLPLTSWYQPTREDAADGAAPPQLMKAPEERLMFLRFNYSKKRLLNLQRQIRKFGLTLAWAQDFMHWHRRFEHFREYLVHTNLALVLAMAKRTRLGEVDFAEVVSEGNMALLARSTNFPSIAGSSSAPTPVARSSRHSAGLP